MVRWTEINVNDAAVTTKYMIIDCTRSVLVEIGLHDTMDRKGEKYMVFTWLSSVYWESVVDESEYSKAGARGLDSLGVRDGEEGREVSRISKY